MRDSPHVCQKVDKTLAFGKYLYLSANSFILTLYETITDISKSKIIETIRMIFLNKDDRDDFTSLLEKKYVLIFKEYWKQTTLHLSKLLIKPLMISSQ